MTDKFDLNVLKDIPSLSGEQLKQLEASLQNEFKTLGKLYLKSRLSRIDHLLDSVNDYVRLMQDYDKNWNKIHKFESDSIDRVRTNQERICLEGETAKTNTFDYPAYEQEIKDIVKNIQSPLLVDKLLDNDEEINSGLPFKSKFDKYIQGFSRDLKGIQKENQCETQRINHKIDADKVLIWKNYQKELINYKYYLLDKDLNQLNQLMKSYYDINSNHTQSQWDHYHNSTMSIDKLKSMPPHDNYYQIRKPIKNKVELTNIKLDRIKRMQQFETSQNLYSIPNKKIKLLECSGLTEDEIENDLLMVRKAVANKEEVLAEPEVEIEQEQEQELDPELELEPELDPEQEEKEHEHENISANQSPSSQINKYNELLALSTADDSFTFQQLPPISKFAVQ